MLVNSEYEGSLKYLPELVPSENRYSFSRNSIHVSGAVCRSNRKETNTPLMVAKQMSPCMGIRTHMT